MYTIIVLNAIMIVLLPTLWVVGWRSKFMLEKHSGMRTEVQREQTAHFVKATMPIWLIIVLVEADQIIHLLLVSRDFWMFWHGFFLASLLFLVPLLLINIKEFSRQRRENRQRLQREDVV